MQTNILLIDVPDSAYKGGGGGTSPGDNFAWKISPFQIGDKNFPADYFRRNLTSVFPDLRKCYLPMVSAFLGTDGTVLFIFCPSHCMLGSYRL